MSSSSGNSYELRDVENQKGPNAAVVGVGNDYEKRPSYVQEDGAVAGETFDYGIPPTTATAIPARERKKVPER